MQKAAGVWQWALGHPDANQARVDLLRLEAEAAEFDTAHRDLKAASGFHGETAKVFLGWLDARAGERDFDRHPDPSANSVEAVEIVTSTGSRAANGRSLLLQSSTAGSRIDDMSVVLASARLIHTPAFADPKAQTRFIQDRCEDFAANARNLLYVALTRARDRLVLEWPGFVTARDEETSAADCLFHIFED